MSDRDVKSRRYTTAIVTILSCLAGTVWLGLAMPAASQSWARTKMPSGEINLGAVEEYRRLCEGSGAEACLVAYRGRLVLEWYSPSYREPIYTMSSVKSWTALLVGIAVAEGHIKSIDDPVSDYIPEWTAGMESGVTIRHLLTMTSGLSTRRDESGDRQSIGFVENKNEFVLSLPLDYAPGKRWSYSNEGVQLLSPLLERACGVPVDEFARARLFEPLGMSHTRLHVFPAGQAWTYADAETSLTDFARVGQLILDEGMVGKQQVVSRSWIQQCLSPIPQNANYGMLWWLHYREQRAPFGNYLSRIFSRVFGARSDRPSPFAFATHGYRNTDCYVIPEDHIVAARMQMLPSPLGSVAYNRERTLAILDEVVNIKR